MNVWLWHVHGSWTTAFVQGHHEYFVPVTPDRGPEGRGRARTWDWPASVHEVPAATARDVPVDVVVMQRPEELRHGVNDWLGRRPGIDVPAVYVEHNTPQGRVDDMRHPAADRADVVVAHVTQFNALFWDTGRAPTTVIEHGIVDPGHRYTGELARAAVVMNDPQRRGRVVGADLLGRFGSACPLDVYGMRSELVCGLGDLPQDEMHTQMARRRVYLHPFRWTSLGLSLIEAMHLGLPVVALGTTAVPEAVPAEAGVVSTDIDELSVALRTFVAEPDWSRTTGAAARDYALGAFGLDRFLDDWDLLLEEVAR
ncbi:MAG TPA: glycosyltransferase [Acidimicrobiia bacterium]|nr:glycosyltransferase [Acidimicrobiia bacterium]